MKYIVQNIHKSYKITINFILYCSIHARRNYNKHVSCWMQSVLLVWHT